MKKRITLLALSACISVAHAESQINRLTTKTPVSSQWLRGIDSTGTFSASQPAATDVTNAQAKVDNNASLSALSSSYAGPVVRMGYAAAGDAPPVVYTLSGSACSLNAGAGDGGLQVPAADGKCWIAQFSGPADARVWGAKCDNATTDDAAPLTKWAAALPTLKQLYLPGFCKTTVAINLGTGNGFTVVGPGSASAGIVYAGTDTTNDIIKIGASSPQSGQWNVSGWTVKSTTTMTGGAGVHAVNLVQSRFNDFIVGGQSNTLNLYHGLWFDAVDRIILDHYDLAAIGDALRVNGTVGAGAKADLLVGIGKISRATVGVHIGGGFGGFTSGGADIIANGTNVLIDNALVAETNREIFFGSDTLIDTATAGCGVDINETGAGREWISFTGTWLATATASALCVRSAYTGIVKYSGGTIYNAQADGINNASATARILVSGTHIRVNQGYGINNVGGSPNILAADVTYYGNVIGETSGMPSAAMSLTSGTINSPCITTENGICADLGKTFKAHFRANQNADTLIGVTNGTSGASATAGIQLTGGTSNAFVVWQVKDNSGAPTLTWTTGSALTQYVFDKPIKTTSLIGSGSAPTCSNTGFGTSPTCAFGSSSNTLDGVAAITAGAGASATGTLTLTFASALGSAGPICNAWYDDTGTAWNAGALTPHVTAISTSAVTFTWNNNAVALTNGSTYRIMYHCFGK